MEPKTDNSPLLSIIIPVHNGAATISQCLKSITRSAFKDYEIIVVDDGSRDATVTIAEMFPCRIYSFEKSQGAAKARNFGAEKSAGKYLFFTDSDIMIQPDTLEKIYNTLIANQHFHAENR